MLCFTLHLLALHPEVQEELAAEARASQTPTSPAGAEPALVTRVLRFVAKHFEAKVPPLAEAHEAELDGVILTECGKVADPADSVLAFRYRRACEELIANAAVANVFVDRTIR